MPHDPVGRGVAVSQREDGLPRQPEIDLHHEMTAVAGDPPSAGSPPRGSARHGSRGRDHFLRRVDDRCELRTGGAAARRVHQVGGAHLAAAIHARAAMLRAGVLAAYGTCLHFIGRKDRGRLLCASSPVLAADQASRAVSAAQMPRAVHLSIHHAHGLMRRADGLVAAGARRHFIHAHRLVRSALAVADTRHAQPAAALGCVRPALLRMPVADDPPAAGAGLETCRADGVVALGADPLVCRAMVHPARRTDAGVLRAGGLLIDPAGGNTMVSAEVLAAHGAARGARVTDAVPRFVPAHDEL